MTIKIERIANGFLVTDEAEHPEDVTRRYSVTDDESCGAYSGSDAKTMYDLLWLVKELVGMTESRYDSRRVYIELKHGDKVECFDENCELCKEEFENARYSLDWEAERADEIGRRKKVKPHPDSCKSEEQILAECDDEE